MLVFWKFTIDTKQVTRYFNYHTSENVDTISEKGPCRLVKRFGILIKM